MRILRHFLELPSDLRSSSALPFRVLMLR